MNRNPFPPPLTVVSLLAGILLALSPAPGTAQIGWCKKCVASDLPAVDGSPVLTASGEVWLRGFEVSDRDTLRTYYVLRRGDMEDEPRLVLLPEWLRVDDATGTHVWGVWRDSMDRPHVVGRRLVALGEAGER